MTMTMLLLFLLFLKMTTRFGAKRARTGGIFSASYSRFFSGFSEEDASLLLLLLNERTMIKRTENPRLSGRSIDDDARKFPSLSPSLLLLRKRGFGWCEKENRFKALLLLLLLLIVSRGMVLCSFFPPQLLRTKISHEGVLWLVGWRKVTLSLDEREQRHETRKSADAESDSPRRSDVFVFTRR